MRIHLEGSLATNLRAAVASAERLRGHSVYADTLEFWQELLASARRTKRKPRASEEMDRLICKLEDLLVDRVEKRAGR